MSKSKFDQTREKIGRHTLAQNAEGVLIYEQESV